MWPNWKENCRFGHIYWRKLSWKTSFFMQQKLLRNDQIPLNFINAWSLFRFSRKFSFCAVSVICRFIHCMKNVQIWSFFWSVFFCIQSEYSKIRTRKCSAFGYFSGSDIFLYLDKVQTWKRLNITRPDNCILSHITSPILHSYRNQ